MSDFSINFGALNSGVSTPIIEPKKIFSTLRRNEKFRRPSDEQGEVLEQWFDRRDDKDLTLKMNTGCGKTLVGLLVLLSSMREGKGPALYICPNNYLINQVSKEADELGIKTCTNPKDPEFLASRSILIINVHKLFNGKSVFGVRNKKIDVGTIIFDDAHACLETISQQFTMRLTSDSEPYKKIINLFEDSLSQQSPAGWLEIKNEDPARTMQIPYWSWKEKNRQVLEILAAYTDEEDILFTWPLLCDFLTLCSCSLNRGVMEIHPTCIPVDIIPSFSDAGRRIYMTATLADDGILVTHLDADPKCIATPIQPTGSGDMGDRLIITPQEINPDITEDEIKTLVQKISKVVNTVVIIPSNSRLEFWEDIAQQIANSDNFASCVENLRTGHVGLTVFINRYDGIDLPKDACRLLVLDGLPEAQSLHDKAELNVLDGTTRQLMRQVQRIEQGMGRGVRTNEDYCAVILMGAKLADRLHNPEARKYFTAATLAQIELSDQIAKQAKGQPISGVENVLNYCLYADSSWIEASRQALVNAPPPQAGVVNNVDIAVRSAFKEAIIGQWGTAQGVIQDSLNGYVTASNQEKGYMKQRLAEYQYHTDPLQAQQTQLSAVKLNNRLFRPVEGVVYKKLVHPVGGQVSEAYNFIRGRFLDGNDLILYTNSLIEDLQFGRPEDADRFEATVKELGRLLGITSQRPEQEVGRGPDNLWCVDSSHFLVIECKSGASTLEISKKDCNQLGGSVRWFHSNYPGGNTCTPIMIHPSIIFDKYSTPEVETKILDCEMLEHLRTSLRGYSKALAANGTLTDINNYAALLDHYGLSASKFVTTYTKSFRRA